MSETTYPLRGDLSRSASPGRRWVVTPLCLSLLVHLVLFTLIEGFDLFQVRRPDPEEETVFTIETGLVSEDSLRGETWTPNYTAAKIRATRNASDLSPRLFPERHDPGPRGELSEVRPLSRYPEEELPILSRTDLSKRSHALVREGERAAVDPGKRQADYVPSGRTVAPVPVVSIDAAPDVRDKAGGLTDLMKAVKPGVPNAGSAPVLLLKPPSGGAVTPAPNVSDLDPNAEGLFADRGPPVPEETLAVGVKVDVYGEPGSDLRYFRLTIRESQEPRLKVIAKNVLFVIDISSSIRLKMLKKVRAAVAQAAAAFNPGDRFNVVRFSERSFKAFDDFVPATPANIRRAANSIQKEPGQVRTDVYTALKAVIAGLPTDDRMSHQPTNLYLITDGNPTAGVQEIRDIVKLSDVTRPNHSIFAVNPGAGTANAYLLDLLAYRNRGVFVQAASPATADRRVRALLAQFKNPVLIDLRAQYANFREDEIYPKTLPNLYSGRPIVIYGRCRPGKAIAVRVIGSGVDGRRKFLVRRTLPELLSGDKSIAREWGRGKIHYLSSLIAREGKRARYLEQIRQLSKKYGLVSPFR